MTQNYGGQTSCGNPECRPDPKLISKLDNFDALVEALEECIEAFRLTREYVGADRLPATKGWTWFDAVTKARNAIKSAKGA